MDLVAEYAHAYGTTPRADQPWHEVLALASRVARFDIRERLRIADGWTIGQVPAESDRAVWSLQYGKFKRLAYPHEEQ